MNKMNEILYGYDLFGEPCDPPISNILSERFISPPFSVLDTRSGQWQDRKRAWLSLGIQSEIGRGGGLNYVSETSNNRKPECLS